MNLTQNDLIREVEFEQKILTDQLNVSGSIIFANCFDNLF